MFCVEETDSQPHTPREILQQSYSYAVTAKRLCENIEQRIHQNLPTMETVAFTATVLVKICHLDLERKMSNDYTAPQAMLQKFKGLELGFYHLTSNTLCYPWL